MKGGYYFILNGYLLSRSFIPIPVPVPLSSFIIQLLRAGTPDYLNDRCTLSTFPFCDAYVVELNIETTLATNWFGRIGHVFLVEFELMEQCVFDDAHSGESLGEKLRQECVSGAVTASLCGTV